MDPLTLAIVAVIGILSTGAALPERSNEVVWAALGVVAWAVFGLGATNVEIYAQTTVYETSYGSLAFLAVALVLVNMVVLLWGTARLLKPKEDASEVHRGPV